MLVFSNLTSPGSPSFYIACNFPKEQGHKGRGLSSEENENLNTQQDTDVEDTGKENQLAFMSSYHSWAVNLKVSHYS